MVHGGERPRRFLLRPGNAGETAKWRLTACGNFLPGRSDDRAVERLNLVRSGLNSITTKDTKVHKGNLAGSSFVNLRVLCGYWVFGQRRNFATSCTLF